MTLRRWVNIYNYFDTGDMPGTLYKTKAAAMKNRDNDINHIACVEVEIKYKDGEGLTQ